MDTLNARISIALAAAAASLALVSTATATTGTPTDTTAPTTTLPQRGLDQGASVGTFDAEGRGVVIVRGNLTVYGRIVGVMNVRDIGGRAVVKINGVVQRGRLVGGVRVYSFARGTRNFYARGRNIRVSLSTGKRGSVRVSSLGRGLVLRMSGKGTYVLNNVQPRRAWTGTIMPLAIKPS
ncbi:MAG TPA: hypothetical protein PLV41_06815 [Miltoncostaeales bacterium]|jgi:hypothetical protein|nr:hypothetical protein [Miltoncostaeales bacterium]